MATSAIAAMMDSFVERISRVFDVGRFMSLARSLIRDELEEIRILPRENSRCPCVVPVRYSGHPGPDAPRRRLHSSEISSPTADAIPAIDRSDSRGS